MVDPQSEQQQNSVEDGSASDGHREEELKAFDETKGGVKGLVDAGISKLPQIFISPTHPSLCASASSLPIPVIDLNHFQQPTTLRKHIIDEVRHASETWGFFQVVNHGIPKHDLDDMIEGVRRFNEQPHHVKKQYYSRDTSKKVRFFSNFDLYQSKAANWRDTILCAMAPHSPNPQEIPSACREITIRYSEHMKKLGVGVLELLSEALGLKPKHLEDMECGKGHTLVSHYYPACPEPDKTMGTAEHSDPDFFTILLQDNIGGLQLLYQSHWLHIHPLEGALVLISNDRFKSARHRVLANLEGPRISVACFFSTHYQPSQLLYGPIKELLSEECPALYKQTRVSDYVAYYNSRGLGHPISALDHYRL
ncbi:1-aminocyclopropane-1-carboxylate oxidase-like protein 1-like [Senna tora]|uniref:1-aminocyclopropane-1-carboxylate oxidase-like protein 1-like n=1 Tax=Senna tora TaxID=362788 RepID=A0A834TI16_9FABA|nr:1-aminocyclopropane-1-carboxylate oxidase-like protein 1-like [Senna tora]